MKRIGERRVTLNSELDVLLWIVGLFVGRVNVYTRFEASVYINKAFVKPSIEKAAVSVKYRQNGLYLSVDAEK